MRKRDHGPQPCSHAQSPTGLDLGIFTTLSMPCPRRLDSGSSRYITSKLLRSRPTATHAYQVRAAIFRSTLVDGRAAVQCNALRGPDVSIARRLCEGHFDRLECRQARMQHGHLGTGWHQPPSGGRTGVLRLVPAARDYRPGTEAAAAAATSQLAGKPATR